MSGTRITELIINSMSNKNKIISAVRQNKPSQESPLPPLNNYDTGSENLEDTFKHSCINAGARVIELDNIKMIKDWYPAIFNKHVSYYSNIEGLNASIDISEIKNTAELTNLHVAILNSHLGVAENGAIWIKGTSLPYRVIPIIVENLILVLSKENIVRNMHQAVLKMQMNDSSYGVFIAGPSKTADIEQVLVKGAHGPKSLDVILVK